MEFNAGSHISPPPTPTAPKSKFESLPTELRLQIYCLLLDGRPQNCLLDRCEISRSYPTPKLYPAILAVNRFISAEAYPVLYGENAFLFLGLTGIAHQIAELHQLLSRRAGLPKFQRPPLLPARSRQLIKHVVAAPLELARTDWIDRLLELAPDTRTVEFDFWVHARQNPRILEPVGTISTLNASIPAIKSSINTSTQTFRIGIRAFADYFDARFYHFRTKRALPNVQLAVVDLKGLDEMQEKRRKVHEALHFMIVIMSQRPLMPNTVTLPEEALVWVEQGMLLHKDYAGFWSPDELTVNSKNEKWIPVDAKGHVVNIGSESKSMTWQRSPNSHVESKALYGYSD